MSDQAPIATQSASYTNMKSWRTRFALKSNTIPRAMRLNRGTRSAGLHHHQFGTGRVEVSCSAS